jgi:hypothetical protein
MAFWGLAGRKTALSAVPGEAIQNSSVEPGASAGLTSGGHGTEPHEVNVFISYSRKDLEFAKRLVGALEWHGLKINIDERDLPTLQDWRRELLGFIAEADAVVFIVSPQSIRSPMCAWEVGQVAQLNKRLAPVVLERVDDDRIPEAIAKINYLFFDPPNDFDMQCAKLAAALQTDIGWVKDHTRLGGLARRWDQQGRRASMLLRGKDIKEAESWLAQRPKFAPEVVDLQRLFIRRSRKSQRQRKHIAIAGALVALLAVSGVPVVFYPNHTYVALMSLASLRKVALVQSDRIPMAETAMVRLRATIQVLADSLAQDAARFLSNKDHAFNAWAVAQTMVAIKGLRNIDWPSVEGYFESQMSARCACWQEEAEKQPHTGASGWVLYAMGNYGAVAPNAVLEYVLNLQSQDGWWPLHPTTGAQSNASTYATAWALLGLTAQMDKIADAALKARIGTAIGAGMAWLQRARLKGKASWKDYPASNEGRETIGVSGLALHVLHTLRFSAEMDVIDKEWLTRLPVDELEADEVDVTNAGITLKSGSPEIDHTRNNRLSWALAAAADAYAKGSALQRARVVAWLELVLRRNLATESVLRQNWVVAELLIALRHVERQLQ